jgi:hypothetical protein
MQTPTLDSKEGHPTLLAVGFWEPLDFGAGFGRGGFVFFAAA